MTTVAPVLTSTDVHAAAQRIGRYARRTPVMHTEIDGRALVLKLEYLQRSGSFKLRGALNGLLTGSPTDHVVAASGGNHGLGVATAAALLDMAATVFVPESVPAMKARYIEAAGARLIRHGSTVAEAAEAASEFAAQPGHRFVHPYDDAAVVAGQGTLGVEIVEDAPEVDSVVVAAGGGGLAAGTALAIGDRTTVTVEPTNCRAVHDGLAAGTPVDSPVDSIAASALGASRIGELPLAVLRGHDVESLLVSDEQLLSARDRLWEELRIAVEPAAAAPLAAWLAGQVPGGMPCLVICGANADWKAQ
ncbi:serine/threonine dehydratase [Pseudonocardia spinosispora]|uniref:serine/threonine dehydratase n=1 Tax=Pseudonocardia spinosispora TaxID=103441 RepID=UPI0012EC4719|nr:serine/threonine dehydratase [Pseudonocardia spinosispora]